MSVFDEVGVGVFRRRYESLDLNVGVVLGAEAVLLVDSRASHRQANDLRDELRQLTRLPVAWVVNTHYHWDHTWGNAVFAQAAIWGHDLCQQQMVEHGEETRSQMIEWTSPEYHDDLKQVVITPPNNTFGDTAQIDVGGRSVELSYHGRGHTNSDIVVRVADAGVLFAGDLLEESGPPSFGDAFPLDWPPTLAAIGWEETIVPGHGEVVGPSFMEKQGAEIATIANRARAGHDAATPIESLIEIGPYPKETLRQAMQRAYAQLEGKI